MRTKNARKLGTEYQLNMSAQRALMRRAFSIYEMKQYLQAQWQKRRSDSARHRPPARTELPRRCSLRP